jgi:hypothetical protein
VGHSKAWLTLHTGALVGSADWRACMIEAPLRATMCWGEVWCVCIVVNITTDGSVAKEMSRHLAQSTHTPEPATRVRVACPCLRDTSTFTVGRTKS